MNPMRRILAPLVAASLAACAADTWSPPANFFVEVTAGAPGAVAGPGQTLGPIRLEVRDDQGRVAPDLVVEVVVSEGGGSLSTSEWSTNSAGEIEVEWTLGADIGPQRLIITPLGGEALHLTTEVTGFYAKHLAVGLFMACAIDFDDRTWCWGDGGRDGIARGDGGVDTLPDWRPIPVVGGHRFVRIAVGSDVACGLDGAGAAWCWGADDLGQLGLGVEASDLCFGYLPCSRTPLPVSGGRTFADITIADQTVCATTPAAEVWCWGANSMGQVGSGSFSTAVRTPIRAQLSDSSVQLVNARDSFCARLPAGTVECWGAGAAIQVGTTTAADTAVPTPVPLAEVIAKLFSGPAGYCARRADQATWCWGEFYTVNAGPTRHTILDQFPVLGANWFGDVWALDVTGRLQLGWRDGFHDRSGGERLTTIGSGGENGCGIGGGHQVWCWGSTTEGELGNGSVWVAHDYYHYPPVPVGGWYPLP